MKNLFPKKLWLLRAYVVILIGFAELILTLYVGASIFNFASRQTILGGLIMGIAGLYLVVVSLGILLISQIILLFLGIHDNIDDMRKKALDENFTVDLIAEKEKDSLKTFNSFFTIALIVLSLIFSISSINGLTSQVNYKEGDTQLQNKADSISNAIIPTNEPNAAVDDPGTIKIGSQIWTKENLNISTYRNGDLIPEVTSMDEWRNLTTGAWCYMENITENGRFSGKLYNWYAVNDPRGLAPIGYHLPSIAEWKTLVNFVGGEEIAGSNLKESINVHWGTKDWAIPKASGTNSTGFTAIPGGLRWTSGKFTNASYEASGYWWSSSEDNSNLGFCVCMMANSSKTFFESAGKQLGLSVRCIKD